MVYARQLDRRNEDLKRSGLEMFKISRDIAHTVKYFIFQRVYSVQFENNSTYISSYGNSNSSLTGLCLNVALIKADTL